MAPRQLGSYAQGACVACVACVAWVWAMGADAAAYQSLSFMALPLQASENPVPRWQVQPSSQAFVYPVPFFRHCPPQPQSWSQPPPKTHQSQPSSHPSPPTPPSRTKARA